MRLTLRTLLAYLDDTLGAILKYQDDVIQVRGAGVRSLLDKIGT